jgi:hypothetical protein
MVGQMWRVNPVGVCSGGDGWEYLTCGDTTDGDAPGCFGCGLGLAFIAFGRGRIGLDALGFFHSEGEQDKCTLARCELSGYRQVKPPFYAAIFRRRE